MSEEEIIKIMKNLVLMPYDWKITDKYDGKIDFIGSLEGNEAIQGLLDLYNKEKEKNKELENADLTTVYMNGFYDGEKKWKDKIQNKIQKINYKTQYAECIEGNENDIRLLQELLKGE